MNTLFEYSALFLVFLVTLFFIGKKIYYYLRNILSGPTDNRSSKNIKKCSHCD